MPKEQWRLGTDRPSLLLLADSMGHGAARGRVVDHLGARGLLRGQHRVTIDPPADNAAAIRCYEKAGFRRVGVMRRAWRDPGGIWQDVLLMELVTPAPTRP